jgi:hypothetical protein
MHTRGNWDEPIQPAGGQQWGRRWCDSGKSCTRCEGRGLCSSPMDGYVSCWKCGGSGMEPEPKKETNEKIDI